jgi:hypothetical protein
MNTYNILEMCDDRVTGLWAFPNTKQGQADGDVLFEKLVADNLDYQDDYQTCIDFYLEKGVFQIGTYTVRIVVSS